MIPMKISKIEINDLPLGQFEGDIVLVDKKDQIKEVIDEISRHELVGFDTETRPSFTKGTQHQVALLQLATEDVAFLIRLNQIGMPGILKELLETKHIVKVGAAVHYDLKALKVMIYANCHIQQGCHSSATLAHEQLVLIEYINLATLAHVSRQDTHLDIAF